MLPKLLLFIPPCRSFVFLHSQRTLRANMKKRTSIVGNVTIMAEVDLAESQMEVLVHFQVCFSEARM